MCDNRDDLDDLGVDTCCFRRLAIVRMKLKDSVDLWEKYGEPNLGTNEARACS